MSILVIGRTGQAARALARRAAARRMPLEALGRPDIDLERPVELARAIALRQPRVVINAAAFTAVDRAEDEAERAFMINGAGAGAVAQAAATKGAAVIHFSTDYVYDGEKAAPYVETDETRPRGAYGVSKLAGEHAVLEANPRAIVLRTAWLFDASGANFVRTMLRQAKSRALVRVVADQRGCPTFVDDLADAALDIAARPDQRGIYHCAGAGEASWAEFAEEIFAQSRTRGGPSAAVQPIASADYPTRARRPANSRLACGKLAADYGVELRPWREALGACMDEIAAGGWRVE